MYKKKKKNGYEMMIGAHPLTIVFRWMKTTLEPQASITSPKCHTLSIYHYKPHTKVKCSSA